MRKRKTIAVIAADTFSEYVNEILKGISEQCALLDYDTAVFHMMFNQNSDSGLQNGEDNIFSLINSDVICGAVFLCGNFHKSVLKTRLEERLKAMNIPVAPVDGFSSLGDTIIAEDTELFEKITDHFIEKHGCTDIMCLTGFKEVPHSFSRAEGYKRSLEKHGIPVDEDKIIFGDFWKLSAQKLADELVSKKRSLPQAIVCANDSMAVELCNCLVNNGISVPDDVMISGYDATREAADNTPSITTLFPQNFNLGVDAVCKIHEKLTGIYPVTVEMSKGFIITGQSCGCGEDFRKMLKKRQSYNENIRDFQKRYDESDMAEAVLEVSNFEELLRKINKYTDLLNELDIFMLCMCDKWDDLDEQEENYICEGYSENMSVRMIHSKGEFISCEEKFSSHDILPDIIYEYCDSPSMFFLLPMHFQDRCFGYSIFKFSNIETAVSRLYATWCRNLDIALEFLRVRTRLITMNQRISLSSIRDTLTGLYNRKGFKRYSESFFKKAKTEGRKLLVMVADLDMLKFINDNYGHIEGDYAIAVCGKILNSCCTNDEICARIGGDEYAIVGCFDYTDEIIKGYTKYISEYFERFNQNSEKEYEVGASIGYFCEIPTEEMTFLDCFNIADKYMYSDKFRRKKFRMI